MTDWQIAFFSAWAGWIAKAFYDVTAPIVVAIFRNAWRDVHRL